MPKAMKPQPVFKTKRIGPGKKRECTALVAFQFDEDGKLFPESGVILNIFGGTGGGKEPAEKLAAMLNEAWDKFHKGEE